MKKLDLTKPLERNGHLVQYVGRFVSASGLDRLAFYDAGIGLIIRDEYGLPDNKTNVPVINSPPPVVTTYQNVYNMLASGCQSLLTPPPTTAALQGQYICTLEISRQGGEIVSVKIVENKQ